MRTIIHVDDRLLVRAKAQAAWRGPGREAKR